MQIRPVGVELFHAGRQAGGRSDGRKDGQTGRQADRQTDIHEEANSRFSQFCKRAKTWKLFDHMSKHRPVHYIAATYEKK